jgi:7-cyano-7-deazaguanine synthase
MTEKSRQPALVLLSGGLDSSVLLHLVARRLHDGAVYAISFDYGQRHARELDCATRQAATVGVTEHRIVDASFFAELVRGGTSLVQGGAEVPDLADVAEADRVQPPTYVPNRNMMLLSMAAAHAEASGIADVYYGAQAQDEYGYWDCTAEFLTGINAVLALNRRTPVVVHAPLMNQSKADNVRMGLDLGVDFAQTWSCYRGKDRACGTCPTCVERLKAFAAAGMEDPVPYA